MDPSPGTVAQQLCNIGEALSEPIVKGPNKQGGSGSRILDSLQHDECSVYSLLPSWNNKHSHGGRKEGERPQQPTSPTAAHLLAMSSLEPWTVTEGYNFRLSWDPSWPVT